jgi:hypothetical protein
MVLAVLTTHQEWPPLVLLLCGCLGVIGLALAQIYLAQQDMFTSTCAASQPLYNRSIGGIIATIAILAFPCISLITSIWISLSDPRALYPMLVAAFLLAVLGVVVGVVNDKLLTRLVQQTQQSPANTQAATTLDTPTTTALAIEMDTGMLMVTANTYLAVLFLATLLELLVPAEYFHTIMYGLVIPAPILIAIIIQGLHLYQLGEEQACSHPSHPIMRNLTIASLIGCVLCVGCALWLWWAGRRHRRRYHPQELSL